MEQDMCLLCVLAGGGEWNAYAGWENSPADSDSLLAWELLIWGIVFLCFVINVAVLTSLLWIALMHTLGSSIFRVSIRGKEAGFIDVLMKHWLPDLAL